MAPPADASSLRAAIVATALKQVGKPYVWGADNPKVGFDCSGLVEYAYRANGVSIPHNSVAQWDACTHIPFSQLQKGDPCFFDSPSDPPQPGHEALYIGGGQVVVAPYAGARVEIALLATFTPWQEGGGNFLGDAAAGASAGSTAPPAGASTAVEVAGLGCATLVLPWLAVIIALVTLLAVRL